ncbi:TPA: hypothetical protein NKX25_002856 [Vibrio parahaemolyticus]|nr:hypothetical protein [Vibrio parahaemolyticus]EGR2274736.1 hypothetical protein [Vibrio parahaemolyticus]EHH1251564.1 hypothetical protein [Vibrio parahaemolyticus]EHW0633222.1 hypothetical protein [Vibrio parahaemolyticus]EIU6848032.1 hypothetical protein [Vibrio parahaemolyticus]
MLHENWSLYLNSEPCMYISEFPMYSDITVFGELLEGMGPLSFHNSLPIKQESSGEVVIPVVVRISNYLKPLSTDFSKSSYNHYHGGWLPDEIAALMSLALGARFYAGDSIREFDACTSDPLGKPRFRNLVHPPLSNIPMQRVVLPEVRQRKDLREVQFFESFGKLSPDVAEKVVKCCRQYQNALWVSETNPELCWLMLISAIEIAANEWAKNEQSELYNLANSYPEFFEQLLQNGDEDLLKSAADTFSPITKATSKFIKFCKHFSPETLTQKDSRGFKYSSTKLTNALRTIYNHRSQALHAGVPFPAPMCEPPEEYEQGIYQQVPNQLGVYMRGATWVGADIPMTLHLFHFLAREILVKWVRSLESEG